MNLTKKERGLLIFNSVAMTVVAIVLVVLYYFAPHMFNTLGILIAILFIPMTTNLFLILRPKNFNPKLIDIELHKDRINQELKRAEINPDGTIVTIVEKVGYADPEYALKPRRGWYWRDKGKIVLTERELIFLGKKRIRFSIFLSEIMAIQAFISRAGFYTFTCFEIVYNDQLQKVSAVFMGLPGSSLDPMVELGEKSSKLMELIQKWYDTWKNG